jgi:hypothetical protein
VQKAPRIIVKRSPLAKLRSGPPKRLCGGGAYGRSSTSMDCISNAAEAAAQRQSAVSCQVWLAAGLLQLARLAGGRRESSGGPPLALGRLLSSAAAAWPLLAAGPLYHMDEAAHSRTSGCATWDSPAACYRWLLLCCPLLTPRPA